MSGNYIGELETYETYMISAYTNGGDKLVNWFLRNGEDTTPEMIEEQLAMFDVALYDDYIENFEYYEL